MRVAFTVAAAGVSLRAPFGEGGPAIKVRRGDRATVPAGARRDTPAVAD